VTRDIQWNDTSRTPPSIYGDIASDPVKPRHTLGTRGYRPRGKRRTQDRLLRNVIGIMSIDASAK
jgi:hypothetical protein